MMGLLDILCAFDWITPLRAEIDDLRFGPNHTFYIYEQCGYSANSIERMLRRGGVQTWGKMIVNGDIMITVRKDQSGAANAILASHGLPIHYGAL